MEHAQKEAGTLQLVPLANATPDNWSSYDTVFIGYPIWWFEAAWPVESFVQANDFTGKDGDPLLHFRQLGHRQQRQTAGSGRRNRYLVGRPAFLLRRQRERYPQLAGSPWRAESLCKDPFHEQLYLSESYKSLLWPGGCVKEYLACLTKKAGTILLAYGGGSIKANGVYDEISGILHTAGKTVVEFAGISPHASYTKVQEGAQLARQHKVDMILAVGGGSVMDLLQSCQSGPPGIAGTSGLTSGPGRVSLRWSPCPWALL